MSFVKTSNKHEQWINYCHQNIDLIQSMELTEWVFKKENNFREFVTFGKMNEEEGSYFKFENLNEDLFWGLFDFIQNYFDMDATLFDEFERVRINKGNS